MKGDGLGLRAHRPSQTPWEVGKWVGVILVKRSLRIQTNLFHKPLSA